MTFYTLGTSDRSLSEFIELLRYYGIELVVDIRRFPTSKFAHFKRENLEKFLKKENIDYFYLGEELGGYRSGGYENYVKTEEFKKGLQKLIDLAHHKRTAIFCAERFAFRCHRRFVGFALRESGYEVIHIIEKDKTWIPREHGDLKG
ncbi:MAG: DUF488 domain-containing protein [Candidatus Omnitrophica bacterium]|nr:DUF488 domain-containing protein [Candidatus Omnitrophota bacterium]MCM8794076.1 DUF488 domain-containing protein [Candidatus Omnitrophota bacterium]